MEEKLKIGKLSFCAQHDAIAQRGNTRFVQRSHMEKPDISEGALNA